MQFSTLALVASFAAGALADLHFRAICVDAGDVYNNAATVQACTYYKNRNTGTKQWDTCPDCVMTTDTMALCNSDAKHIGGDEITYYCKLAGASNAKTS